MLLTRVSYGLILAALVALALGIFVVNDSNALLYVAIATSVVALGVVIFGAARRAKEVGGVLEPEPELVASSLTGDDLKPSRAAATTALLDVDEDEDEEDEDDDEDTVAIRPARRPAARKPAARKPAARKPAPRKPASRPTAAKAASKPATSGNVVIVPGRDKFHKAGCRFVKDNDDAETITMAVAKRRGLNACGVCKP